MLLKNKGYGIIWQAKKLVKFWSKPNNLPSVGIVCKYDVSQNMVRYLNLGNVPDKNGIPYANALVRCNKITRTQCMYY